MKFQNIVTLFKRCNFIKTLRVRKKIECPDGGKSLILVYKKTGFRYNKNSKIIMRNDAKLEMGKVWGREPKNISDVSIGSNSILEITGYVTAFHGTTLSVQGGGHLTLGNCLINNKCSIMCHKEISIGNGTDIAAGVLVQDYDGHVLLPNSRETSVAPIHIGDNVWIGANSIILKGVTIGNGAVIAAGSIVTKDIPPKCLAAGVPARVIRENVEWEH